MKTIDLVAGARPNFMKIAPVLRRLRTEEWCCVRLVHAGQHYDEAMSDAFFRDLGLPEPDHHLGSGSGTHAEQTARVMVAYEKLCMASPPDWTVVVGDVNSTLACALAAKKLGLPVAHLEAGLRSGDMTMPEEINRILTDRIADALWTPSADADDNLRREGAEESRIIRVGNVMIDTLELMRPKLSGTELRARLGLGVGQYVVATMHRPGNVDDKETLRSIVGQLGLLARQIQVAFPLHPRTRMRLERFGLLGDLKAPGLRIMEPLGYIDFMGLVLGASAVITDSGGVQEETAYLGIPCITVRPSTERPVTIAEGTNRLTTPSGILELAEIAIGGGWEIKGPPALWDGRAAERIVADIRRRLGL